MKLNRVYLPEVSTTTIELNGEYVHIPSTFIEVHYECQTDKIIVELYDGHDFHLLASYDIEESDNVDALELLGRGYGIDLYDGYSVDAAIEGILEQCKE